MTQLLAKYGSVLVVLVAIGGLVAAPSQAQSPEAHCTSSTVLSCFITGASNDHVIAIEGGNVKCTENSGVKGARFSATASKTASTIDFTATYGNGNKGCAYAGSVSTVQMEGCVYRVHLVEEGTSPFPTTTAIICPAGKSITINVPNLPCTITIGEQTGLEGLTLENTGTEPTSLAGTLALTGIKYTFTGAGCPKAGTFNTGTLNGTLTLSGYEDIGGSEGPKVGLHVF